MSRITAQDVARAAMVMLHSMHAAAAGKRAGVVCVLCGAPFHSRHTDACAWSKLTIMVKAYERDLRVGAEQALQETHHKEHTP